ncbi:MAG TPA: SH3 domain-containing protein [Gemmataceae bacterium]
MSLARTCAVFTLCALLTGALRAEPAERPAVVLPPGVELRSGPSPRYPAAGRLRPGQRVVVHHEENGWLAVLPPEGSVSWVNHRHLGELDPSGGPQNVPLLADRVEVRVGSGPDAPPLPVKQVTLPRGTIVEVLGPRAVAENSVWYAITPPVGEYRYVPREAVSPESSPPAPAGEVFLASARRAPAGYAGEEPSAAPGPPGPARASDHPLWVRAEEAERRGDRAAAEESYRRLMEELRRGGGDHDLLLLCSNRLHRLRQGADAPGGGRAPALLRPPPPAAGPGPAPAYTAAATSVARLRASGPGVLRRSGFYIDGRPAYVLEADQGGRLYVTAQPGVNLEPYVHRRVELYGPVVYRGDIRGGNYMSVARVTWIR